MRGLWITALTIFFLPLCRVYHDAEVNITANFTSEQPIPYAPKRHLPNTTSSSILDLDPQRTVFYVGGYPQHFTVNTQIKTMLQWKRISLKSNLWTEQDKSMHGWAPTCDFLCFSFAGSRGAALPRVPRLRETALLQRAATLPLQQQARCQHAGRCARSNVSVENSALQIFKQWRGKATGRHAGYPEPRCPTSTREAATVKPWWRNRTTGGDASLNCTQTAGRPMPCCSTWAQK